jgi:hypothetical protein
MRATASLGHPDRHTTDMITAVVVVSKVCRHVVDRVETEPVLAGITPT